MRAETTGLGSEERLIFLIVFPAATLFMVLLVNLQVVQKRSRCVREKVLLINNKNASQNHPPAQISKNNLDKFCLRGFPHEYSP